MDKLFERVARTQLVVKLGVLGGTVALIFAVFFLGFMGGVSAKEAVDGARRARDRAKRDYETAVTSKEDERKECTKLKRNLKRNKNKMKDVRRKLPDNPSISELIKEIKTKLAGIQLIEYSRLPEEPKRIYSVIPLNLTVRGSYHALLKFFHEVSKMSRIVNIGDTSLTEPLVFAGKTTLKVTFRVETFRYRSRRRRRGKKGKKGKRGKRGKTK